MWWIVYQLAKLPPEVTHVSWSHSTGQSKFRLCLLCESECLWLTLMSPRVRLCLFVLPGPMGYALWFPPYFYETCLYPLFLSHNCSFCFFSLKHPAFSLMILLSMKFLPVQPSPFPFFSTNTGDKEKSQGSLFSIANSRLFWLLKFSNLSSFWGSDTSLPLS